MDGRPQTECLFTAVKKLREEGHDIQVFSAGFGPDDQDLKRVAAGFDFVSFYGHDQYDPVLTDIFKINRKPDNA